mgnify:CR=1 FL=1
MTNVVMSIKPVHMERIKSGVKNHEFRKYVPSRGVDRLWIYTSSAVCALEYVADIDKIVAYPDKIAEDGYGNMEFNMGEKEATYAYHIKSLYRLKKPIHLGELREKFKFTAPQSFFYLDSNVKLKKYLESVEVERVI